METLKVYTKTKDQTLSQSLIHNDNNAKFCCNCYIGPEGPYKIIILIAGYLWLILFLIWLILSLVLFLTNALQMIYLSNYGISYMVG